ncbi:MAG: hypothetical protein H6587_07970 [Flavobacteriales bacterium]|nr:hypothetical protein [Flavobacteriales bacterium]MCB9364489.1 hypothetical protein [Flavobacteriales bacterium]
MTHKEENKLKRLIKKYNPILKESIESALTEDLYNLIIVNGDDKDFELKDLLQEKEQLKSFVLKEFILLNNKPITSELKNMEEISFRKKQVKQGRLKL